MQKLFSTIAISGVFLAATLSAQGTNQIAEQRQNQQNRIAQGVQSGQLTPQETARLERKESSVNREVRSERRLNGGKLTRAQRRRVKRQRNRLSRSIRRNKHDAARQ